MAAAAAEPGPLYGGAAAPAKFATSPVHPGLAAVIAIETLQVAEIAEGGSAYSDTCAQYFYQRRSQPFKFGTLKAAAGSLGGDARGEQAFVGVDVAHACDQGLIQQRCFDGSGGAAQPLEQPIAVELMSEGPGALRS